MLLKIDDLDQARANKAFVQDIFDTLRFLEIPWDEGPRDINEFEQGHSQLHRMALYQNALNQLAGAGKVFACTCSRKQLLSEGTCTCVNRRIPLTTENAAWRLITDNSCELDVKSVTGKNIRAVLPEEMQNFIVRKKDGYPAYQLTSVIDDLFFGVDLVVRGQDLWASTLAQQQLTFVLGDNKFNDIAFYHHPLLMASDGSKLSKSSGATSIKFLRENGNTPADIFTLIAAMCGIEKRVSTWQQLGNILAMQFEI
jgi:glutamyl-tRNA synthetase